MIPTEYIPDYASGFELINYKKFRDTPAVKFYDVTIEDSNARDLVVHTGPSVSPPNDSQGYWQFYMHKHQEDNLLALQGGRTFFLVNFDWEQPYHIVRCEQDGAILKIPVGTFHRSVSDTNGSIVMNQAIRDDAFNVETEFTPYRSAAIPMLLTLTSVGSEPPIVH